jgi:predicted acetyltransferase
VGGTPAFALVRPARDLLDQYVDALKSGWSPDNLRPQTANDYLAQIAEDADAFLERQVDRDPQGRTVALPDGTHAPRLPGYSLWMSDGDFCGSINLRWQPGTAALPPYVLGHIGYAVVPWKRGRGYAKEALRLMLRHARGEGLEHVVISTDASNMASRRVIEANGGIFVEQYTRPAQYGGTAGLKYQVPTPEVPA